MQTISPAECGAYTGEWVARRVLQPSHWPLDSSTSSQNATTPPPRNHDTRNYPRLTPPSTTTSCTGISKVGRFCSWRTNSEQLLIGITYYEFVEEWMDGWLLGCMDKWMDGTKGWMGRKDRWMDKWTNRWLDIRIVGCMYWPVLCKSMQMSGIVWETKNANKYLKIVKVTDCHV